MLPMKRFEWISNLGQTVIYEMWKKFVELRRKGIRSFFCVK